MEVNIPLDKPEGAKKRHLPNNVVQKNQQDVISEGASVTTMQSTETTSECTGKESIKDKLEQHGREFRDFTKRSQQ